MRGNFHPKRKAADSGGFERALFRISTRDGFAATAGLRSSWKAVTWATPLGLQVESTNLSHCLGRPDREAGADCIVALAGCAVGSSYWFAFAGKTST
jgi:hypothetical protein